MSSDGFREIRKWRGLELGEDSCLFLGASVGCAPRDSLWQRERCRTEICVTDNYSDLFFFYFPFFS